MGYRKKSKDIYPNFLKSGLAYPYYLDYANGMRDAIRLAIEVVSAVLLLSVTGAAAVIIWFIVGGQS